MEQQAGTRQERSLPRRDCLYAVFDSEQELGEAERALVEEGMRPQRIHEVSRRGVLARIERLFMRLGEDLPGLQRYAEHRAGGRSVLSLAISGRDEALRHTATLARHGGYDIVFFQSVTGEILRRQP